MHPVAVRRILRLAVMTAFGLWLSQAVNWGVAFMTPVLVSVLLALPLPAPSLKQCLIFLLALLMPIWLMSWFLVPLMTHQPMVGMLLLILACFWAFYYSAGGGSPVLGALMTIGLAVVAAIGSVSVDLLIAVDQAMSINAVIAIGLFWLAYVLLPDKPLDGGSKAAPKAEAPPRQLAIRSAWRSTVIVLPVVVFFLFYAGSASYLLVMIKVASMGQQAENDQTRAAGKSLLMSTFVGGIGAVIMWVAMSAWPSLLNLVLLVLLGGLVMGRRIFHGQGMAAGADMWSYAFMTMLVIILPSVMDGMGGSAAGAKFFDRMSMVAWTTLYAVAAVSVFDAFWREKPFDAVTD